MQARHTTTVISDDLSEVEARNLLRAIVEATPLVIYAKDRSRRFILSNRQHNLLVSRPAADILGHTDSDLFGEEAEPVEATSQHVLDTGEHVAQEFVLTLEEKAHTFLETIFPLEDAEGQRVGLAGIATDITERRNLERTLLQRNEDLSLALDELRTTQAALLEQQKLAALGELVAGVAHEVNTPLSVGLTGASVLLDTGDDLRNLVSRGKLSLRTLNASIERITETATLIRSSLEHAAHLIQSFKQVAVDRQVASVRDVSVDTWLDEIRQSLEPTARRENVRLRVVTNGVGRLRLATGELQQVLTNLVMNALVHAFPTQPVDPTITLSCRLTPTHFVLIIDDNGVGIPSGLSERIFEPFVTTRRGQGGTGLGLHIAWSIVTATFGGTLRLLPKDTAGAQFEAQLPLRPGSLEVLTD